MVDQKLGYGIAVLLSMLVGFGGSQYLTQDQLDHSYYCPANSKVMMFDRLSSTAKTGYYMIDGVQKSSTCTNSAWIKLSDYAKSQGIDPNSLLEKQQVIQDQGSGSPIASGVQGDSVCDAPELGGCRSVR